MRLEAPNHFAERDIDAILAQAFELCEDLEGKFSKFREASDVSRINQATLEREIPVSREFFELITLATDVWRISDGAFNPFGDAGAGELPLRIREDRASVFAAKTRECTLDLSGIAKGFVVDKISAFILSKLPGVSGVLNAGGDLLFLNTCERQAEVRLAHGTEARALVIDDNALATSALSEYLHNATSSTVYTQTPRAGLNEDNVVSAIAPSCAIADALTKVGWFASEASALTCAEKFSAKILILDRSGAITQSFGGT
jgi:thiamine biosynthesis lipoprotein